MIGAQSSARSSDESAQLTIPSHISPGPIDSPLEQVKLLLARVLWVARRSKTSSSNMIAQKAEIERMRDL
jgi:hypothetical protein